MEQRSLCSPDQICQDDPELRVVLQQLIKAHGVHAVEQELRSIEAANQVENTRSRGRPTGPAIDDWPALQEAAAIWRQQGYGPVWPALIAVAKSLRGEPESNARRLLSRLQETRPGWDENYRRAGIGDLRSAVFDRKIRRVITRTGPHYLAALVKAVSNLYRDDAEQLWWVESVRKDFGSLTLEDIAILISPSPAQRLFPYHLINLDSRYVLLSGDLCLPETPPKIILQDPIIFNELTIAHLSRKVHVTLSEESTSDEAIGFDIIPYKHWNYLVSRYDRPCKSISRSSVSSAADQFWQSKSDFVELNPTHWTNDIPEFRQTMFKFVDDELREADRLAGVIAKMLIDRNSSSSFALAVFVRLLGDYIASNVDEDRWAEALDAIGLLTNAALARVGYEHGLLKRGLKRHPKLDPLRHKELDAESSSVSAAADRFWQSKSDFVELNPTHWTNDIPEFRQTMFKFDDDELREAGRLAGVISKMLIDRNSSSSIALAVFVRLLGGYISSNVDEHRWVEALDAIGLLTNAALARVGYEHGLLKRGCQATSETGPFAT